MITTLAALLLSAAPVTVSPDLQVSELRPGVWLHVSWGRLSDGSRYPSNGLVVRHGREATVIDTAWGVEPTEALLGWIEREARLRVVRVIATHGHADRVGGAPALERRGIPLERLGELRVGGARRRGPVEVFKPGPAHTPDNTMVWIPAHRILFGGCAVKSADSKVLGNLADADLSAWPGSMRRAKTRYPKAAVVVPGHGDPGGLELIDHTVALLARGR